MPAKISFVVASVDRDEQLQHCLSSIEKAHEYNKNTLIEVLVVIQKAKNKKDLLINYPQIITVYYIDKLGLSVARNFAIEKSRGDYLVFLDDDAMVKEDFIDVLSKSILKYPQAGAFCGRLLDLDKKTPFSVLFNNNKEKILRRLDYQYFMGSAHVLSRRVIEKIGGYDERFGVGAQYYRGGEETELFIRLKAANELVLYLPDLVFFHPIIYPSANYTINYGHAFGAMFTKNCFYDKPFCFVYIYILLRTITKMSIRLLQKKLFGGRYIELDERYQYGGWLKGVLMGIRDYIKNEL